MKNIVDLWLDEMMDQPIRQLIEADRRDYGMVLEFIRQRRKAKADKARKEKERGKR